MHGILIVLIFTFFTQLMRGILTDYENAFEVLLQDLEEL